MRLRWLTEASEDLADISHYLSVNNSPIRVSIITEIYEAIRSLREIPYRGRPGVRPETRELVFARLPYLVTYRIVHDTVEILHIRHGARLPPPS